VNSNPLKFFVFQRRLWSWCEQDTTCMVTLS